MDWQTSHILVVADQPEQGDLLQRTLGSQIADCTIAAVHTLEQALDYLATHAPPRLIISAWQLPDGEVLTLLTHPTIQQRIPTIVIIDTQDVQTAVAAMRAGAYDCIVTSDALVEQLLTSVSQITQTPDQPFNSPEQTYQHLLDSLIDVVYSIDPHGTITYINAAVQRYGYTPAELIGRSFTDMLHPDDLAQALILLAQIGDRSEAVADYRFRTHQGDTRWMRSSLRPIMRDSVLYEIRGVLTDITEHMSIQSQLGERERQLELALDAARMGTWNWDVASNKVTWSDRVMTLFGLEPGDFDGSYAMYLDLILPEDRLRVEQAIQTLLQDQTQSYSVQHRIQLPDGDVRWMECWGRMEYATDWQPECLTGVIFDITKRKRAEIALQEERDLLASIMHTSVAAIVVLNPHGQITFVNANAERILGIQHAELIKRTYDAPEWQATAIDGGPWPDENYPFRQVLTTGEPVFDVRHAIRWPDGTCKLLSINSAPIKNDSGTIELVVMLVNDITGQIEAERSLRASEERYRLISETVSDYAYAYRFNADGSVVLEWITAAAQRITGYSPHEMTSTDAWRTLIHPDDHYTNMKRGQVVRSGESSVCELKIIAKDGKIVWLRFYDKPVWDEQQQRIAYVYGAAQDITTIKQLEQQLLQAQKMEVVGMLAGGIAHDFNNLLTVILGNSEFALTSLAPDAESYEDVVQIQHAAERAAALTRQLLTFSRQQVVQPASINLNTIVLHMSRLLVRVLGEDIELVMRLDPHLASVYADAVQLEQVLMNLAINARDAMPHGGTLLIETAHAQLDSVVSDDPLVQPGEYVLLAISDTGSGISSEIQERMFEPFFSTKEHGRGTGLGLATVQTIINQHNGLIWVYSEPGQGTTFKIYLPQFQGERDERHTLVQAAGVPYAIGTVLVVEDERDVRDVTSRILRDHGYQVLEASDGPAALQIVERYPDTIDVLLTDVIMPGGLSGQQLAAEINTRYPHIKVLYVSGYTDSAMLQRGLLTLDAAFLQKPFTAETLLHKLWKLVNPHADDSASD